MTISNPYTNSYLNLFNTMVIDKTKVSIINSVVGKINAGKARYEGIERQTKVPWFFIGVIHYMEASCDFTKHLHNGDPLSTRTRNVPAGRPATGSAPFTWEVSAVDALKLMQYDQVENWSVPNMLYLFEKYNGFGYRKPSININSPYLWSMSNQYTKGKYVADGKYDPNAVSKQVGAAVILKTVMEKNNLLNAAVAGGGIIAALTVAAIILLCR